MRHIQRDGFHVFDWPDRKDLPILDICDEVPEIVEKHYLVNTSFDSGFLTLNEDQKSKGWFMVGRLAHSPLIETVDDIPHDQFNEWLVFDRPTRVAQFETLVNFIGFSPVDFDWKEKLQNFWLQIGYFRPLSIIAENYTPYVVTRDPVVISKLVSHPVLGR